MTTGDTSEGSSLRPWVRVVLAGFAVAALIGAGLAVRGALTSDDGDEPASVDAAPSLADADAGRTLGHLVEIRVRAATGSVTIEMPQGVRVVNAGTARPEDLFWSDDGIVVSLRATQEMRALVVVAGHPDRISDWAVDATEAGVAEVEILAVAPDDRRRSVVRQRIEGTDVLHVDGRRMQAAPADVGPSPLPSVVLAHYVPWYPDGNYEGYNDVPAEPFSTRDVDAVEASIREAQAAGLDGFAVSFWGLPHPDFEAYMEAAERVPGWRTALLLETKIANDRATPDVLPDASVVARWLATVLERYGDASTFLRVDDSPVVLAYRSDLLSALEWRDVRTQLSVGGFDVFVVGGDAQAEQLAELDGTFIYNSFVFDDLAAAYRVRSERTQTHHLVHPGEPRKVWIGTAAPGMDTAMENVDHRYVSRRAGATLRMQWETAAEHGADAMLVVSWNEFIEDTAIMPSPTWGRRYLDLMAELIARAR